MAKPSNKWIRQRRVELSSHTSQAEKCAYNNLLKLGYNPIRQYPIWTGRRIYFADLYIRDLRLVIEIDGGYHTTSKQKRLDKNRSGGLWRLGLHVVRLSNHDARDVIKIKSKLQLIKSKFVYTKRN